ncbi:N-acetyl-gamma-glutamyl-phosphate reductase [Candidatus Uzinura diaspidicola str. ASNER]|uniref:N-acetyl-gamma-glutamyl-phosphate reductase n=1 Tax=Candidatus Uzinura diaspidicola str. ASNER TaxID=1133592 RepID=L7VG85_9FLAO|nr:N-acetyl-gamma-glutamyl-phosphate reductase [Candidatus Uzinura diaspidicola str. ASNER]
MIKIGLLGGSGFTAGELLRILLKHPKVNISSVVSKSQAGLPVSKVHKDLVGETAIFFTDHLDDDIEVVFLCLGTNKSKECLKSLSYKTSIIDISNDFRLLKNSSGRYFIYGLSELYSDRIKKARNIANPGCFATAIQLALLPLANMSFLKDDIHISAITGSSGGGRSSISEYSNFSFRANNISTYKVFTHQHIKEIYQNLKFLQRDFQQRIFFTPYKGNFTRGIFATIYVRSSISLKDIEDIYKTFYKSHPFTFLSENPIHIKQVVNTNKCLLHIDKENGFLIISSVIDNLLKGASGQAIQNLNLMYGYEETCGLELKSLAI